MKPVQLLGLAFVAAVFAGVVTLVSMGFFQQKPGDQIQRALVAAAIVAGIAFIVVLVVVALLLLAVDPADVGKTIDRPVLLPEGDEDAAPSAPDDTTPGSDEPER
jgi:TRAP-type C4-dicarboxylate transport system permease small subunit